MENADIGDPVNYRAKLANASCRTARSGLRFREKSSSPEAPVFFPKTLPFRKHSPPGPRSSTTVTGSDRDARGKKTESAHPAAGNQAAAKRKRPGTYLQTVESDTGNMQSSRQEQAAGGTLQGRIESKSNHLIQKIMFTQFNQLMTESVDITLVIRKSATGMTVSVLPKSNGLKDEAQNHIVPLTLSGTPEELDGGFFQTIARPVQKVSGLLTNMAEFEKQADKTAKDSKAAKETKAKETKEEKEKREKYEKLMKKADELITAKNHKARTGQGIRQPSADKGNRGKNQGADRRTRQGQPVRHGSL